MTPCFEKKQCYLRTRIENPFKITATRLSRTALIKMVEFKILPFSFIIHSTF